MAGARVDLEFTPNPNTLKYVTDTPLLLGGAFSFRTIEEATDRSDLAMSLLSLEGISSLMIGKNFVTVTLANQDQLTELNDKIIACVTDFLNSGKPAVAASAVTAAESTKKTGANEIESKIISILDQEIRPQVAMDGGDISFEKFEGGIVYLHMQGSCAGCPSSTATLKMGIENRLKDSIPEVQEVVAI
jgi:Fe-S cluster biogenesis protein NfuA